MRQQIVLMPNTSSIPIFICEGVARRMREEFERYRCREIQLPVQHDPLPDVCQRYIFSISAIMQQQALGTSVTSCSSKR